MRAVIVTAAAIALTAWAAVLAPAQEAPLPWASEFSVRQAPRLDTVSWQETWPTLVYFRRGGLEPGEAWFVCTGAAHVEIFLWLESEELAAWFERTPGLAGPAWIELVADEARESLWIRSFEHGEMYGRWEATMAWNAPSAPYGHQPRYETDWLDAFATASRVSFVTPAFEVDLSQAEGDAENRSAFVQACLAM